MIPSMIGNSPSIQSARTIIARIADSDATVLITGESGTGKDLAAKMLHYSSARADAPFLNVTCTALPEPLLESELFGHEKGAFTDARQAHVGLLQAAHGGTVLLDEVGDMPYALQSKLLRFLEERTIRRVGASTELSVDVRVIAATNVDLLEAVRRRAFREDLFYRLAVLELPLPPLRERGDDVVLLARHFVDTYCGNHHRAAVSVTPATCELLLSHDWPGNLRELRNVIERSVLLLESDTLDAGDIRMSSSSRKAPDLFQLPPEGVDLAALERVLVMQAVERANGNYTEAARMLRMHRDQIRYRLHKYGVAVPRPHRASRRRGRDVTS